eukprot:3311745-Pleurochrysis_carterae.AAC.2
MLNVPASIAVHHRAFGINNAGPYLGHTRCLSPSKAASCEMNIFGRMRYCGRSVSYSQLVHTYIAVLSQTAVIEVALNKFKTLSKSALEYTTKCTPRRDHTPSIKLVSNVALAKKGSERSMKASSPRDALLMGHRKSENRSEVLSQMKISQVPETHPSFNQFSPILSRPFCLAYPYPQCALISKYQVAQNRFEGNKKEMKLRAVARGVRQKP